jgi:hypothetical protein
LCIADEVQTALGRTGTHFWGFETQGVIPDIVTMAKGIGNGCPLAAVVTTPAIAKALTGNLHFNTFGGNPVVCAQGKAVLEVVEREQLQANSRDVGGYLRAGLEKLQQKHSLIGEVRGLGLMLGVELVADRQTKEPAREECAQVLEKAREMGLLLGRGGLFGNTLRINLRCASPGAMQASCSKSSTPASPVVSQNCHHCCSSPASARIFGSGRVVKSRGCTFARCRRGQTTVPPATRDKERRFRKSRPAKVADALESTTGRPSVGGWRPSRLASWCRSPSDWLCRGRRASLCLFSPG